MSGKNMRKIRVAACLLAITLSLASCLGSKMASASGGEVTGSSGRAFTEPTPYGMTMVKRGHLHMGIDHQDSLWGDRHL